MKRKTASKLIYALGMAGAIAAPAISFLCKFPVLKEKNYDQAVSWFAVAMLVLCCVPFFKKIRELFKSPDALLLWTVIFVIFAVAEPIVSGMKLVAFCGVCGNLFAKLLFYISKKVEEHEPKPKEERNDESE